MLKQLNYLTCRLGWDEGFIDGCCEGWDDGLQLGRADGCELG